MSIPTENYTYGFNFIFAVLAMIPTVPILIYIIVPVFYDNNVVNCYEVGVNSRLSVCLLLFIFLFTHSIWRCDLINALVNS